MISIVPMAPPMPGELSATMALLGLLAEQADTGAGVAVRLTERFPRAGWSRNVAHNSLPSLERQGLVRVAQRHPEDTASLNCYEATLAGVAKLQEWLRGSALVPPILRDELQGRIEFSTPEDLRAMIQEIAAEEIACRAYFASVQLKDRQARRLRERRRTAGAAPDPKVLSREVQLADEAVVWGQRAARLKALREHLEDVLEELDGTVHPSGGQYG